MVQKERARSVEEEIEARQELEKEKSSEMTPEEKFRADLDQLLFNARQEYLQAGGILLDCDGLEREIAERRGGVREED